ncbi:MAG: ABC transporter substrate-binding protein [Acidobacteriota bacterium]
MSAQTPMAEQTVSSRQTVNAQQTAITEPELSLPPGSMRRLRRSRVILGLACSLLLAATLACAGPETEPLELRVGLIAPLSGALEKNLGDPARQGAELAVAHINQQGLRIAGQPYRVSLWLEDSHDKPETAVQAARRLINQKRVDALIGPILSRNALAAATVAEQQQVPMISPTASAPELTRDRRFVFRGTFVNDDQGRALAEFARKRLAADTAAVLYDVASPYNRQVAEIFHQAFERLGGATVALETFTTGEQDFSEPLERIRNAAPDVLLLPNYADEVPLQVLQARSRGLTATFLGTDSWDGDSYPKQAEFEGAYFINDWQLSAAGLQSAASREFERRYRQSFAGQPKSVSALVFDTFGLLFEAIQQQDSRDHLSIREGLAGLATYRGVTGSFSFRGTGDPTKSLYIFRIEDGRIVFAEEITP